LRYSIKSLGGVFFFGKSRHKNLKQNVKISGMCCYTHLASFLVPIARLLGPEKREQRLRQFSDKRGKGERVEGGDKVKDIVQPQRGGSRWVPSDSPRLCTMYTITDVFRYT
jgi:hypothetical protein